MAGGGVRYGDICLSSQRHTLESEKCAAPFIQNRPAAYGPAGPLRCIVARGRDCSTMNTPLANAMPRMINFLSLLCKRRTAAAIACAGIISGASARAATHDSFASAYDFGAVTSAPALSIAHGAGYETGEPHQIAGYGSAWAVWQAPGTDSSLLVSTILLSAVLASILGPVWQLSRKSCGVLCPSSVTQGEPSLSRSWRASVTALAWLENHGCCRVQPLWRWVGLPQIPPPPMAVRLMMRSPRRRR